LSIGMMAPGGVLDHAAGSGPFASLWWAREAAEPGESDRLVAPGPASCSEGVEKGLLLAPVCRTCCVQPSGRSHAVGDALKVWMMGLVALLHNSSEVEIAS
jgi:hypothetical protein